MTHPLYVAFVWHMHQPSYVDRASGELALPWVRLHAAKDYLHMVEVLEDYPRVHATFNMVPSLVEQLDAYVAGTLVDRAWNISLRRSLSEDDKRYIDSLFFSVSRERVIGAYPRYDQLYRLREQAAGDLDLLSDVYWRDLIAWFNLAWIDPGWLRRDPVLRGLVAKGSGYNLDDIAVILSKHKEAMAGTLAAYRRLQRRGQVELSVTPQFHPILPLLIDSSCATEPSPWLRLPEVRYRRPEDALEQLHRAIAQHAEVFGRPPAGLWPSEGAVSQDLVGLLARVPGIRWMATDEAILGRSFGRSIERNGWGYLTEPRFLYRPYRAKSVDHDVAVVFRDHLLSDRIGFVYQGMAGNQGAEDLVFRLACIHEAVKNDPEPSLVSIILDGENCWEHYEKNGETFLRALYEKLSTESWVRAVTVSEFLSEFPPAAEIPRLATGSWINGNLETWIGEDAQNRAWEYLYRAREELAAAEASGTFPRERIGAARDSMLAAEGSDWFWWYYSHNVSEQDDLFDSLFRGHLAAGYEALGLKVPAWVSTPIAGRGQKLASRAASSYVHPPIDSGSLSPAHWDAAGYVVPSGSSGSMQQASGLLKRLYFGYDETYLYLRLESHSSLMGYSVEAYISRLGEVESNDGVDGGTKGAEVRSATVGASRELSIKPDGSSAELSHWQENGGWIKFPANLKLAAGDGVTEVAVPLEALGVGIGVMIGISVVLFKEGLVVQRLPEQGEIIVGLRSVVESAPIPV